MLRAMKQALKALSDWRRRRQAIGELNAMSNEQLADIGIARYEVEDFVSGRIPEARRAPRPPRLVVSNPPITAKPAACCEPPCCAA